MKYRNIHTGDIITAHLYNGDNQALRANMPLLHSNAMNFFCTQHHRTDFLLYDDEQKDGKFFARAIPKITFEKNFVPYKEPEISNAMQAVKCLEEGKAIHLEKDYSYIKQEQYIFNLYRKDDNSVIERNIPLAIIFGGNNWQLYEEPKYKEVSYIEAIEYFESNGNGKVTFENMILRGDAFENVYFHLLVDNETNIRKTINCKHMKSNKWRIYEN